MFLWHYLKTKWTDGLPPTNSNYVKYIVFIISLHYSVFVVAQTAVKNSITRTPVSFATVSFGNGNGIFADGEGVFLFTKKIYPDIDTLYISAIGFKDFKIAALHLPKDIFLTPQVNELEEVLISTDLNRKFKIEKRKPTTHNDFFKCWLPTIESEIAVYFPNESETIKKITKVFFPLKIEASEWKQRNRSNAKKRSFSTLFKVQFYDNIDGLPGNPINYDPITFIATEENKDLYKLDIEEQHIYVPKGGIFVSLQVLGYTDKNNRLLPNKKYKEIKTKTGIKKVPTTFRPLLPFTNKIPSINTYTKRVFINDEKWLRHEKKNEKTPSSLITEGYNNYGIGIYLKVYKND